MDINEYANQLLLEFLDAFHVALSSRLRSEFGEDWLENGVKRHFAPEYFERTVKMLESPMRVVDMQREPEELFGIEHLWNIVDGNWALFKNDFDNKMRAEVYLGEISELRHNLAHRRQRHLVRRDDLIRFTQNGRVLLAAIGAPESERFASVVDSLTQGGSPWGGSVDGDLPPHDEIYGEWIGRPNELRTLTDWFASDSKQIIVWGYGGSGKSALAYKFAKEIQEAAPAGLDAIVWLTAKRGEFVEGTARERTPGFDNVETFCDGIWRSLYGPDSGSVTGEDLIAELTTSKWLIVIDDLDTVLPDQETAQFLLFDLRLCDSKILYTSRQQVPGLKYLEVPPFDGEELNDFISSSAIEHGADVDTCLSRAKGIRSVTDGYPLFIDDLIRYSMLVGVDRALEEWGQRKGDAAREYALRRQLEHLGGVSGDALLAVAVADRPLEMVEVSSVAGMTDEDSEQGVRDLLSWRLLHQLANSDSSDPAYSMNANTRRLTKKTFGSSPRMAGFEASFKALTGERVPEAKRRAIAEVISHSRAILSAHRTDAAVEFIQNSMTGELAESADLYGSIGWVYSQDWAANADKAREAFETAHRLGSRKHDIYHHWVRLERRTAEEAVRIIPDRELLGLWRHAINVVQFGIDRCGPTDELYQQVGYLSSRLARTHEHLNEFAPAQGANREAVEWFKRALDAPAAGFRPVEKSQIYRGLALAYEGLDDIDGLAQALKNWRGVASADPVYQAEVTRLKYRVPELLTRIPSL